MSNDLRDRHLFWDHWSRDHRQLGEKINQLEESLAAANRTDSKQQLTALRAELQQHFQEEADGGFLEDAACRAPRLAHKATTIEQQHPQLLQRLDQILEKLADTRVSLDDGVADFQSFAMEMREHEREEHALVCEAFGICSD